jgi:hypothetical protein
MTLFKRLFLVLSIAVTGSLAMAAAAIAAGGGGGLGAGNYTFTDASALAQFGAPVTPNLAPQFIISVDRNHSDFRPSGGPHVVTHTTMVFIQISTTAINGFGCFKVPASDFTVGSTLQSAELHATLTNACTFAEAKSGAAKAGIPLAGGGGGLPASLRVDVVWTGTGVVGTTRDVATSQCLGFTINKLLNSHSAGVTAVGSVSSPSTGTLLPSSPADQGTSLQRSDVFMHITGAQKDACFGLA